jgi:hypothetical protein
MSSVLARIQQLHRDRRARWAAIAVTDTGINIPNPRVRIVPVADPPPPPVRVPTPVVAVAKPAPESGKIIVPTGGPTVERIGKAVAGFYGLTWRELTSSWRVQKRVKPRFVAFFLAKAITNRSLSYIGRTFRRDHTTVINGLRKMQERMSDFAFAAEVAALECSIRRQLKGNGNVTVE